MTFNQAKWDAGINNVPRKSQRWIDAVNYNSDVMLFSAQCWDADIASKHTASTGFHLSGLGLGFLLGGSLIILIVVGLIVMKVVL